MHIFKILLLLCILGAPQVLYAHSPINSGLTTPKSNRSWLHDSAQQAEPLDLSLELMALQMENADCEELSALDEQTKNLFLETVTLLQIPGALSRIVGPDCMFLGEVQEIATLTDPRVTMEDGEETLYFLSERNILIVSHKNRNAIAYTMDRDEDMEPAAFFLDRRNDVLEAASLARILTPPPTPRVSTSNKVSPFINEPIYTNNTDTQSNTYDAPTSFDDSESIPSIINNEAQPFGPKVLPVTEAPDRSGWLIVAVIIMIIFAAVTIVVFRKRK